MASPDSKKMMLEFEVYTRIDVGLEIMSEVMSKTKGMLESVFKHNPTSYHEGERRQVIDVAREVFNKSISPELISKIIEELPKPSFENLEPDSTSSNDNSGPESAAGHTIRQEVFASES